MGEAGHPAERCGRGRGVAIATKPNPDRTDFTAHDQGITVVKFYRVDGREADTGMHRMHCSAAAVLDDVCDALELTEVQRMEVLGLPALAVLGPRLDRARWDTGGAGSGYEKSHIRKHL